MNADRTTIAPADAKSRSPWPLWRKVLAYLLLTALAALSIWFIDRDAMQATHYWDPASADSK